MKLGRVKFDGREYKALFIPETKVAYLYESDFYSENIAFPVPFSSIEFLPPSKPSNIISIGFNYVEHIQEAERRGMVVNHPDEPIITLKGVNSLAAHNQKIKIPKHTNIVEFEGEFAIVIGRRCSHIEEKDAKNYIFGYTIANDLTARDLQFRDGQWARAKSIDSFCPVGPWIETKLDPLNVDISSFLNSVVVQKTNTSKLVFNVYKLTAFVSHYITLVPGDIILTGTPSGMRNIKHGDRVDVVGSGIGTLSNVFVKTFDS